MAIADFWEIKDNYAAGTKQMLNVYHVKRILVGANATDVGQAFIDTILIGDLLFMQDNGVSRSVVEVRNLGTVTDFTEIDSSAHPGTRVGEALPNFTAVGITLLRTRTDIHAGQKRYYAGVEADKDGNLWDATFAALIDGLATSLLVPWEKISAPGIGVCQLVVLKRFCVVAGQDPCLKYRLPLNSAEIDANHYVPISTRTEDLLTSQVSRKRTA